MDFISVSGIIRQDYYHYLNLNDIYIGGLTPAKRKEYFETRTRNFRGCLEDLIFRGKNLIQEAKNKLSGYKVFGKVTFRCEKLDYRAVTITNPNTGFRVTVRKLPMDNDTFYTSFRFRSHVEQGLLLSRSAIKVKLHLRLSAGTLLYDVTAPNSSKIVLSLGSNLDDGEWHTVNASVRGREARLQLDGQTRTKPLNHSLLMQEFANRSRLKIFLGGYDDNRDFPGFVGCILNLQIDSQKISHNNLKKSKRTDDDLKYTCSLVNRCQPNPCKNKGKCSQDWKRYYCNCEYTQFEGERCEISIYKPTCEYYRSMGLKKSMFCLLDSEGQGNTYTALCNVTDGDRKRTYTVITHNKMAKTRVGDARIEEAQYKHYITYPNSIDMKQIAQLIESSKECRQHIRFHCFSSKLLNTPRGPSHAFWLSRDYERQEYWGGAEPGSKRCACGMHEKPSCASGGKYCNCDNRDNQWRVDEGYLTDKSTLPVTGLEFNRKSEKSDFTLGPLECWGNANKTRRTKDKRTNPKPREGSMDDRLVNACPMVENPTTTSPGTPSPTTTPTPSVTRSCTNENDEECINGNSSLPGATTIPGTGHQEEVRQTTAKDQETSWELQETSEISTVAIVMISVALVVIVMLSMKFVLPRVIMCIRTHSKRGEYIVPPAGSSGYPARLLPLVTKRSSIRGRQLTQYGGNGRCVDGNATGGLKSYWV